MAPGDGVAQGALPGRRVPRPAGEQAAAAARGGPASPAARASAPARLPARSPAATHRAGGRSPPPPAHSRCQGEVGFDGLGPLDEEPHRLVLREVLGRGRWRSPWQAQWRHRVLALRPQPQRKRGSSPAPSAWAELSRSSLTAGAASTRCSMLSSTSSRCLVARTSRSRSASGRPPSSRTPRRCAIAAGTSAGSLSGANGTKKTPSAKSSSSSAAACSASRVLPVPPVPVSVSSRTSSRRSSCDDLAHLALPAEERSRLRGRLCGRRIQRIEGRKVGRQFGMEQLIDLFRLQQIAQPVLAQVAQFGTAGSRPRASCWTACVSRICPPCPVARSRESRLRGAAR